jgi:hypothetical protein
MSSKKRNELAQFRDRFRGFRLTAGERIEKVGKSAYRLTGTDEGEAYEALIEFEVIAVADDAEEFADTTSVAFAEASAPSVAEASAPPAAEMSVPSVAGPTMLVAAEVSASSVVDLSTLEVATPSVAEQPPVMPYHPAAIEESDMGFGEPTVASAADGGGLAANHVILSAWPVSMQPTAAEAAGVELATEPALQPESQRAAQRTEALIEAELREIVEASAEQQPKAPESSIAQGEQAVIRTWRDGGHWLGRRFAELFSRTQN